MTLPAPEATQLVYLNISKEISVKKGASKGDKSFHEALDILRHTPGFIRLYWGRRLEQSNTVHLHIVRGTLQQHYDFLSSPAFGTFKKIISTIVSDEPLIRHAMISENSPGCASLGKGAPVTGTAVYLSTTPEWDKDWSTWVSIVQHVPGFMGISGGHIIESINGHEHCFIALVGWESTHVHDAYHMTNHFRKRRNILAGSNRGYDEYGHIAFENNSLLRL